MQSIQSSSPVSLVTPVYNQANFVAATIESVLGQTHKDLEYLVFDDGSTDDTSAALAAFQGQVAIERHANMGQSATLNKAWARCRGRYFGYLSGDDLLLPTAVAELARALDDHPDVAVVYCDFDLIDETGRVVGHPKSPDFRLQDLTEELICQPGVGALFRREVFEQCGGWDPTLAKVPDFEFWLRASRVGAFMRVPKTLGQYRVHQESTAVRPIPVARTLEIVKIMRDHWAGRENTPGAHRAMAKAHLKAAQNHAQSGRPMMALAEFGRAASHRPKTLVSLSSWSALAKGLTMRVFNSSGKLSARLR